MKIRGGRTYRPGMVKLAARSGVNGVSGPRFVLGRRPDKGGRKKVKALTHCGRDIGALASHCATAQGWHRREVARAAMRQSRRVVLGYLRVEALRGTVGLLLRRSLCKTAHQTGNLTRHRGAGHRQERGQDQADDDLSDSPDAQPGQHVPSGGQTYLCFASHLSSSAISFCWSLMIF